LESFSVRVDIVDPHADAEELHHEYGLTLTKEPELNAYDAVIVAVEHKDFVGLDEAYFKSLLKDGKGVVTDIKGIYRGKIKELIYWGL
jgi:UDP-N-acetyl-D-glucosamine/UDP-N-acetyl-D-galactosamine dehydrogenase